MALGALTLPSVSYSFDSQGTAMVPVTAGQGDKVIGKIEVTSPIQQMSEFFAGIDKSLVNLVTFAKKSLDLEEADAREDPLKGLEGDGKEEGDKKGMLDVLKEQFSSLSDAFGEVSIGEKLGAALLIGALFLFSQMEETITKIIEKLVTAFQFVRDKVFGDTENPNANTFAALLAAVVAFKFRGLIVAVGKAALSLGRFLGVNQLLSQYTKMSALIKTKMIPALTNAIKSLPGALWKGVGFVFRGINIASQKLLLGAQGALKSLGGGMTKLFNGVGKAFMLIRVGMMSMMTSLTPIIAPLLPIIAIAAAVAAVFYSLKSGFDTFKTSLENGDSMFTAVLAGLSDAMLTLITLPATLIKNLVGWIAGLLGFESFKEDLESFSFKDMIKNAFSSFTSGMVRVIKAIAKGAAAALAALAPMGESPAEAYQRVYSEVMSSGDSQSTMENVGGAELASNLPNEEGGAELTSNLLNEQGDANAAESFYAQERATKEGNMARARNYTSSMATISQGITSDAALEDNSIETKESPMNQKLQKFMETILELEKMKMERENDKASIAAVNVVNQGANNFSKSESVITGDLNTDNTEPTNKLINSAIAV